MQVDLWAHQQQGVENALAASDGYAFFFEQGTGKTLTTITTLRAWMNAEKRVLPTLILGPPIVVENWRREFEKFSKIPSNRIICLRGTGKKRLELFMDAIAKFKGDCIFITNYETLLMTPVFEAFRVWKPEILVCDESQKVKSLKSKRTKLAVKLADIASRRLLLSGTPVLNSPMDLFSQFRILDRGDTFGKNFTAFQRAYFYDKNAGMPKQKYFPNWVIKTGAYEAINNKIKRRSLRVKKEDCLDLPPLVRQQIFVELSKDQQKHYAQMRDDFVTYVSENQAAAAPLAITKGMKLQQIVSGFLRVIDDEGNEIDFEFKDTPREKALRELLEELAPNHKILIWAAFRKNYEVIGNICDGLGIPYVEVHGTVSAKARDQAVDDFNNDPSVRVFISHPRSGGIGINLVVSDYSIFYSRNFNLEDDLQAEARNHRGGSEIHEKITRIDLITPETIDEHICMALANKQDVSEKLLRDIAGEL
jgi:SNF2 family DNA or RNA helicase